MAGRDLGQASRLAAAAGAFICFKDEVGQNLRPPKARIWARADANPRDRGVRQGIGPSLGGGAGVPQG